MYGLAWVGDACTIQQLRDKGAVSHVERGHDED